MLDDYLKPNKYCDISHPTIQAQAQVLQQNTDLASAIAVWDYISSLPYRLRRWDSLASEILKIGGGMCANKANLQISLLRALKIPAAYGWYKISKEAFKESCPPDFYAQINNITDHIFCYVYLNSSWIACDATPNRHKPTTHIGIYDIRLNQWDGKLAFTLPKEFVIEDLGIFANLDQLFATKSRFSNEELEKIYG